MRTLFSILFSRLYFLCDVDRMSSAGRPVVDDKYEAIVAWANSVENAQKLLTSRLAV